VAISAQSNPDLRFDVFEVDFRSGELRKHGIRTRLQDKPFQLLCFLLERPGEVVTREELKQKLWPADTFVDFDDGLNTAVKKLRDTLGDSAGRSKYIETLPRRGYRFIGTVKQQVSVAERPQLEVVSSRETIIAPSRARVGTWIWVAAAVVCLVVGVAAIGWLWTGHGSPIAIAVLPLNNLSQDSANDYFADGLTDEIIRNLSIIDGLAVRSQTSAFAFKIKPRNVREAGKQLEADYILEGSILRDGQQLRINAQLVRVRDDLTMWSGRYDRELTDVFAIQDEISRGIVNSLRLKLGRGRRRYETSVEAYDLYLRARALWIQRGSAAYPQNVGLYEEAIAKDPSFAPAYAGLAAAYAVNSAQFGNEIDHADQLAKMRAAAEKAILLDPLLAEAHDALGLAHEREGQWEQSEKSFRRAIELNPSNVETYSHVSVWLLLPLGRIEEALHDMLIAERADPLSPAVQDNLAWMLISAGRYSEAASHCQKLPADYQGRIGCLGRVRLGQGRTGEAIQILATSTGRNNLRYLGYAYGRAGRRDEAEKLAAAVGPSSQAIIFAGLGDKERTLEALERMAPLGAARVGRYLSSPEFALLRGDPRVKALRKKVGLPE
jgi:TolB-like protein/DNA-binding winged helix-turn-helix (wHTH) protein